MHTKLDLTDLNKLFNRPASYAPPPTVQIAENRAWLQQFYARVHYTEAMNSKPATTTHGLVVDLSPSSSNATLVEEEDDLMDHFKVCKIEEPFFAVPDIDMDLEQCSRSKMFVEEMARMTEHRRSLSLNTNISLDRSTPSPASSASPASSISSNGKNPFAEPFVPSYAPQLTTSPPPELPAELSDVVWFPTFWTGVSTSDAEAHKSYSVDLVNSTQWTTEALGELAQHFCWKGAEWTTDVSTVAPFARAVHDRFRETYGDLYANCLTRHIREIVVGHFKACWKSDQPHSISYANPPSIPYLASAHSLATFIGDLFSQGLLPRSTIQHCLSVLVAELKSIEHMHAIHLLLLHANTKLWKGKDANTAIKDFIANFTQHASCMGEQSSILGHEITKTELRARAKEITDMINRWQVRRITHDSKAASTDLHAGDKVVSFGLHLGQRR